MTPNTFLGIWQTVDLTNVPQLTLTAVLHLYTSEGGTPYFAVLIDGVEVLHVGEGWDESFDIAVDVSGYTGTHVVKIGVNAENWSAGAVLSAISAIGPDAPPAPVAAFTAYPVAGDAPLKVLFADESSNTPTSWLWSFGDGIFSTEQNPFHTYLLPGVYDVALTATNAGGSDLQLEHDFVTVRVPPPSAVLLWKMQIGEL
jgi:PKD repeat protein